MSRSLDQVAETRQDDGLIGRAAERAQIERLLHAAGAGRSGALVLGGPAGIGKSALLRDAVERATGFRIIELAGNESEMAFGYAAVHQLVAALPDQVEALPAARRAALDAALGHLDDTDANPFLVAMAVLDLLAELARSQCALVVVDDAQWLDDESARVIAFVGRRLQAERIALLIAIRDAEDDLVFAGLDRIDVHGLPASDAHALLARSTGTGLDHAVAERIVVATGGNPLALLELPATLTREQLRGAEPLPDPVPVGRQLSSLFARRAQELGDEARSLLLLAAAEALGDVALLRRAAGTVGIRCWDEAAHEAEASGLVAFTPKVKFRHPLVRSAVYHGALPNDRRVAHAALAAALDSDDDADRRAWHLGAAAVDPDERIARQLEATAERARRRGGSSVAATYLWRAAELTPSPALATRRLLEATRAQTTAANVSRARAMLDRSTVGAHETGQQADAMWTEALIDLVTGNVREAATLLAASLPVTDPDDVELAVGGAVAAGAAALSGGELVPESVRRTIAATAPRLLEGTAIAPYLRGAAGRAIGTDSSHAELRAAVTAGLRDRAELEELAGHHVHVVYFGLVMGAADLLDDAAWDDLTRSWEAVARRTGALAALPLALTFRSWLEVLQGRVGSAASHLAECEALVSLTGARGVLGTPTPAEVLLEAWQADEEAARTKATATIRDAEERGQGIAADQAHAALALLELSFGRYDAALHHAGRIEHHDHIAVGPLVCADLVEAAVRAGRPELAAPGLERLADRVRTSGTPWARALLARSCAVVSTDEEAEVHFETALAELAHCSVESDRARTQLLYGEWLRRARRRREARAVLEDALEHFERTGADAFATRARAELAATGVHVRPKDAPVDLLTPQEAQIARLAAAGERNRDIATQLFLSTSTVEYHLRKVYVKLGLRSRTQLNQVDLGT